MTDEATKTEEVKVEETGEMLEKNEPQTLDEDDKKIAKKRAKKLNIPVELAEEGRRQEKNLIAVTKLTQEFYTKLNALGYHLEAIVKYTSQGVKPTFDLRPMTGEELMRYKAKHPEAEVPKAEEMAKEKPVETYDHSNAGGGGGGEGRTEQVKPEKE